MSTTSWLTTGEALAALGTRPQTLYANVSRGRIRQRPDPADSRRSLYNSEDVERLAARRRGRQSDELRAAQTMRWGDPILVSSLSTIVGGRLLYRGQDAVRLAETADLETVARLLWQPEATAPPLPRWEAVAGVGEPSLRQAFLALAERAATDLPSLGRGSRALQQDAADVLATIAAALLGSPPDHPVPTHQQAATAWNRPAAVDAIRRAMVLLADHELNASTFAARVAVSTGASLAAGVLAGLATLSGPLHGRAAAGLSDLLSRAARLGPAAAVRAFILEGRQLCGFGHTLYPAGDVRAVALLAQIEEPAPFAALRQAVDELAGERPNVDFALAALAAAHDLPPDAPFVLFALARSVGWLAHAMEQAQAGTLIRPRAHYVGPAA